MWWVCQESPRNVFSNPLTLRSIRSSFLFGPPNSIRRSVESRTAEAKENYKRKLPLIGRSRGSGSLKTQFMADRLSSPVREMILSRQWRIRQKRVWVKVFGMSVRNGKQGAQKGHGAGRTAGDFNVTGIMDSTGPATA